MHKLVAQKAIKGFARQIPTKSSLWLLAGIVLPSCLLLPSQLATAQQQEVAAKTETNIPKPNVDKITYEMVKGQAKKLSTEEYKKVSSELPEQLAEMTYSEYRNIRFNPDKAIWKDKSKFELQLFHPGFLYKNPVMLRLVDSNAGSNTVTFKGDKFIYENEAKALEGIAPPDAGFAGFRVHYPLNTHQYKDELAVFLGASYFRIVGPGQTYGISARGLAINTAHASGEEFPEFTRFWIIEPESAADNLVIYALLDSKSVTGAYRFELTAGLTTEVKVNSQIYARTDVEKLGVAPLTSMLLSSETTTKHFDDFRPEVHDSDGLLMITSNGEQIWRQLNNPKSLQVTSMQDTQPKGFGLLQRDTEFDHYSDIEANYHSRPGIWITPDNNWGAGRLELVEIPTNSETNDNIVSYWVPEEQLKKGQTREFNYTLNTVSGDLKQSNLATVVRAMNSWAALPGENNPPAKTVRKIVVDFSENQLTNLTQNIPIEANLQVNGGKYDELIVRQLPDKKSWRVSYTLNADEDRAVDMRLSLSLRGKPISEVWNYVWSRNEIE
ncbi:glucan biosynthesis protein [Aliiglaciecola lipolytica]|uniref:Glucans biosynthesis protein G n=1 Tax=Aliiglaciecola lipolytica E3 TaxID=1127673 RepID=K6YHN8_9ALTE|nr:glucan biosynthesis protein G [Aliiglaciecola lipolytica]GAC16138.1 glucans biosynthesis protein G [Aliiglaciecola lipolytica E3]